MFFSKSLYIFAVFERRGIKIFVVAAASNPSPFGELRDCLEAETIFDDLNFDDLTLMT